MVVNSITWDDPEAERGWGVVQSAVRLIRKLRTEANFKPQQRAVVSLIADDGRVFGIIAQEGTQIKHLAKLEVLYLQLAGCDERFVVTE